MWSSVILV